MGTAFVAAVAQNRSKRRDSALHQQKNRASLRKAIEYFAAVTFACSITYAAFIFHFTLSAVCCIYLLMVVLAALHWGILEATAASLAAFIFLDYFFMEPLFSLQVDGAENWIALGAFEFVGLVVSTLSARLRQQVRIATQERNNVTRLYELSRCVLLLNRRDPPGRQIAHFLQRALGAESVVFFDP